MKVQGEITFSAKRELVWQVLTSPESLQACTPGCKEMKLVADDTYEILIEFGVAAIKGMYQGEIQLMEQTYPQQFTLNIHAEGSVGVVDATAKLILTDEGESTRLAYEGDVQVSGLIAGVGQRMLTGVSKMMLKQFFRDMDKEVELRKQHAL